jgi:hypothetical protein
MIVDTRRKTLRWKDDQWMSVAEWLLNNRASKCEVSGLFAIKAKDIMDAQEAILTSEYHRTGTPIMVDLRKKLQEYLAILIEIRVSEQSKLTDPVQVIIDQAKANDITAQLLSQVSSGQLMDKLIDVLVDRLVERLGTKISDEVIDSLAMMKMGDLPTHSLPSVIQGLPKDEDEDEGNSLFFDSRQPALTNHTIPKSTVSSKLKHNPEVVSAPKVLKPRIALIGFTHNDWNILRIEFPMFELQYFNETSKNLRASLKTFDFGLGAIGRMNGGLHPIAKDTLGKKYFPADGAAYTMRNQLKSWAKAFAEDPSFFQK